MAHECPELETDPDVAAGADRLRDLAGGRVPELALLLGTGWRTLADALGDPQDLDYAELPAFPTLGVRGHEGRLRLGRLADSEVLLLCGREHAYEQGRSGAMAGAIRTLAAAGVRRLLLTNAAGSLDPALPPGTLMLVADHLNLVQDSPLVGARGCARFVDMAQAYDPVLRARARSAAEQSGMALPEGIYAWLRGPQFETPAEIRMLQRLGAQAVGMSTVPETILARHAGLQVLALSMLTNMGCGLSDERLSHAHTLARAEAASAHALRLMQAIVPALAG